VVRKVDTQVRQIGVDILRVSQFLDCLCTDSVPQGGGAGDEVALPVSLEVTGVPGVRHSGPVISRCTGGGRDLPAQRQ
jgi:hypothetical protein